MITLETTQIPNIKAFLDTISFSEGTNIEGGGYNVRFGGTVAHPLTFDSFADHPRISEPFGDSSSDAAGRGQILSKTWDWVKNEFTPPLPDFSPQSQDMAYCFLISSYDALNDVANGNFDVAIQKCCPCWASFPDSDKGGASHYGGQPSKTIQQLRDYYASVGGTFMVA